MTRVIIRSAIVAAASALNAAFLYAQMSLPVPSARAPVTPAESVAAEKNAWVAIRGANHRTGTNAFKAKMRAKGVTGIFDAIKVTPGNEFLVSMGTRRIAPSPPRPNEPAWRSACKASPWWCDLLQMFTAYRMGSIARAESLLASSLASMSPPVRCIWGDVSYLISDRKSRKEYEHMSCEARAEFEEKLWWLADPLHSAPGNDRRIEHFARHVNMRADNEEYFTRVPGLPWGLMVMRRNTHFLHATDPKDGEPRPEPPTGADGFTRKRTEGFLDIAAELRGYSNPLGFGASELSIWERMDRSLRQTVIAGTAPRGVPVARLAFVPAFDAVRDPFGAEPGHWRLDAPVPHEAAISPAGPIVALDHQHAFFRRGALARLVVVTDAASQPLLRGGLMRGALATSHSPRDTPSVERASSQARYVFSPVVPPDSMLVSVEIIAEGRGGGRTRFGAAPQPNSGGRISLSDLALYLPEPEPSSPVAELDSLLGRVLPTTKLAPRSRVGVFWEIYGLRAGDTSTFTVSARRDERPGLVSRAIGGITGAGGAETNIISLEFKDAPAVGNPIEGRKLVLDLSTLRPGSYVVEIRVRVEGEAPAISTRRIEIRGG